MKKTIILECLYPNIFDIDNMRETKSFPFIKNEKNCLPQWYLKTENFDKNCPFSQFKNSSNSTIKTCWGLKRYFSNTLTFPMLQDFHYIYENNYFHMEDNLLATQGIIKSEVHPVSQFKEFLPILESKNLTHPIKLGFPFFLRVKNKDVQLTGIYSDCFWDDKAENNIKIIPGIFDICQQEYLQMNVFFCIKKDSINQHQLIKTGTPFFDLIFNLPYGWKIKLEFLPKTMNEISDIHFKKVIKSQQYSSSTKFFHRVFNKLKSMYDYRN